MLVLDLREKCKAELEKVQSKVTVGWRAGMASLEGGRGEAKKQQTQSNSLSPSVLHPESSDSVRVRVMACLYACHHTKLTTREYLLFSDVVGIHQSHRVAGTEQKEVILIM